jgi:hypothetical protein
MRKRFRAWMPVVLVVVFVTVAAAAAGTAGDSDPPRARFLSPHGQDVETFALAGNPRGDAAVAWLEFTRRGHTRVWLRDRRHGHPFGLPAVLTSSHFSSVSPAVALGEDGSEVVAWIERRHGHQRLIAIARHRYGQFGKAKVLSAGVDPDAGLALAVAPDGTALAAWAKGPRRGLQQLHAAVRRADGRWSHSHTVTHGKWSVTSPRAAFDGAGEATLTWERQSPEGPYVDDLGTGPVAISQVGVAVRPAGGPFGRPHVVSKRTQDANEPVLAENARGDAVVAWDSFSHPFAFRVGYATRRAGQKFGRARWLTAKGGFAALPHPAVDAAGRVTVGWTQAGRRHGRPCDGCVAVRTARGSAGGALSHPRRVSGTRTLLQALAAKPSGAALLVWHVEPRRSITRERIEGRFVMADGTLGTRHRLSRTGQHSEVQALLPANGDGLVAWLAERPAGSRITFVHAHE